MPQCEGSNQSLKHLLFNDGSVTALVYIFVSFTGGGESNQGFVDDEADNSGGSEMEENEEPIQAQTLPWKHEGTAAAPRAQEEFPPWIKNKDYINYSSPSNTLMGKESSLVA